MPCNKFIIINRVVNITTLDMIGALCPIMPNDGERCGIIRTISRTANIHINSTRTNHKITTQRNTNFMFD